VKSDWDAWNSRLLAEEPIVRLILDGTVLRIRLDRKATSISLLVVLGVRAEGQRRSRSCASHQSASCSENSAIRPKVSGRTLTSQGLRP
jgi:transposase-like protein